MKKIIIVLFITITVVFSTAPGHNDFKSEKPEANMDLRPAAKNSSGSFGTLKVHFIDVGQGDCILIQSPDKKNMLIDAGRPIEGKKILQYIKNLGVKKLDTVVCTHTHGDHIGGMPEILQELPTQRLYYSMIPRKLNKYSEVFSAAKRKGASIKPAYPGSHINFSNKIRINVLAPNRKQYERTNNYSIVMKVIYNKTSFLLAADTQYISENEMLAAGYNLKSDVLKIGHHGSTGSTSSAFLRRVAPRYAVILVGKGNPFGHPHKKVLNSLERRNTKVYRTDLHGSVVFSSDGRWISVRSERD